MSDSFRSQLLAGVAGAIFLLAAGGAAAQEATADQPAATTSEVEEVIVTALRRGTSIQDTAASVQAFSAERLEKLNVGNTDMLQTQVPGLIAGVTSGMQTQTYMRGIGNNLTGIAASNSVATYIDGVYIPNAIQAASPFSDTERIEVLKGPQATLYGRNATGGAINIITKEPTLDPSLSASVSVGNYKAYNAQMSINGPIYGDKIAGRLSLMSQEHEGYATNLYLGTHPGGDQQMGVRAAVKFFVTDDFDILLRADHRNIQTGDYVKAAGPLSYIYVTATIPNQYVPDARKFYGEMRSEQPGEDTGGSIRFKWSSAAGELTSVTSNRRFYSGPAYADFDGIVGTHLGTARSELAGEKTSSNQFYHETYLSTPDEYRLQAVIGANYFFHDSIAEVRRITTHPIVGNARRILSNVAWAGFVDLGFDLTPQWRLIGGARYSHEETDYSQLVRVTVQSRPPGFTENSQSWNSISPRVGIEWRPREGRLYYLTATSGFKAGGFNESAPLNPFEPEKIWSYEAGARTTWADGRVRANGSVYYYDYTDLQVSTTKPITLERLVDNAESATLYGLDLELDANVTDQLTTGARLSLLHSEYGNLILCDGIVGPCIAPPNDSGFVNVEGNTLYSAPKVSFSTYADYEFTLPNVPGEFSLHGDAFYRSQVYFNQFEREDQGDPGTWILNAQVGYQSESFWNLSAYITNITDEDLMHSAVSFGSLRLGSAPNVPIGVSLVAARYAPPRLFGVRLGVEF